VPNLRDIRRRIVSVRKTQQITRAMRMVAAAKLRRAQEAILASRPYAERMRATLEEVLRGQRELEHPLLAVREGVHRLEFLVVTSDRGLCGAFNANVLKHVEALAAERASHVAELSYSTAGRKAAEYLRRRRRTLRETWAGIGSVGYAHAAQIAEPLARRYVAGEVDEVVLVYSEFVSALTQRPRHVRLLPMRPGEPQAGAAEPLPYKIEPSPEKLLGVLAPRTLEVEIYRALLENQAGEHAARMTAMEAATRNTEEMIGSLTLQYNRARQAAITKELVEIVTGAQAL
jgi:F-type H+-transporting ATPase subunit gamma